MPKISAAVAAARRDQLLDAAERCFARQGIGGTSMQDIIAESGMSAGGIYGYVAGKAEIIAAVAARRHDRDAAMLAADVADGDPLHALREVASRFIGDLETEQGFETRRVALRLWSEALDSDAVRASVLDGAMVPAAAIEQLLRRLEGDAVGDAAGTARAAVALFQGWLLQRLWGGPMTGDELMAAFDALVSGSRASSGSIRP